MKLEHINISTIWTMLVGTAAAILYMFNTFATASDVQEQATEIELRMNELKLSVSYGQYYDRLDDRDEAVAEGNNELAAEYERQMERLRAKICEQDPEWERCKSEAGQ